MNSPLEVEALENGQENESGIAVVDPSEIVKEEEEECSSIGSNYKCLDCHITFTTSNECEDHLLNHVKQPGVLLQRLSESCLLALKQRRARPPRKGSFARKRAHSYFLPKLKGGRKNSLKLTLKLSGHSNSRSFEVVPPKVLVGPGGFYPVNGSSVEEVKTENLLNEVEWGRSVEGNSQDPIEILDNSDERTFDDVSISCEKENVDKTGQDNNETEDVQGGEEEVDLVEERDFDDDSESLINIEKTDISVPPTPSATPAPTLTPPPSAAPEGGPSPTPSEQLGSEFLPPEGAIRYPSPAMVEINGSAVAEARSPAFPTTSPAPPSQPTPPADSQTPPLTSESQPSSDQESAEQQQDIPSSEQDVGEDISVSRTENQNDFLWNDTEGNEDDSTNNQPLEERDPLMLPEPSSDSQTPERTGDMRQSPNAEQVETTEQSLLRGFLTNHGSDRNVVPVSNVSSLEGFGLGSEYISLERLGDSTMLCDVCGERTTDQAGLEEHRIRAGHFKCTIPECGGIVYRTAEELMAHQQNMHGNQQYNQQSMGMNQSQSQMMNQQSAPVQQLVQQVQRLPVPQMGMQQLNKSPHSAQLSQQIPSNVLNLMPPQQSQYQTSVCRPPPLYPAPATMAPMMQQHPPPPQYVGSQQPQHVMYSQPYPPHSQPYAPNARGPLQLQSRPYSTMMQQMNQHAIRQQAPRIQGPVPQRGMTVQQGMVPPTSVAQNVKRVSQAPVNVGPPNKQRRLDMLIPDRHDDADCHVIAMQKRTDTGPVIGSVQGASPTVSSRTESTINLTDSITLSVRQQQHPPSSSANVKSRSDANTVASLLATRGITVTPAGGSSRSGQVQPQGQQPPQQQQQHRQVVNRSATNNAPPAPPPPQPPQPPVATLNLNSAISIIPTASVRQASKQQPQQQQQQQQQPPPQQQSPSSQQNNNFAVPQGRSAARSLPQAQVERPPRPPTVDLTGDGPPPPPSLNAPMGRGRGRGRGVLSGIGRHTCQVCDKVFSSPDALNQHMTLHRSPGKLPFRCNMCSAQYPTQQGLLQHRQGYHKESPSQPSSELVIPVVDLKHAASLSRLTSLGVRQYIPLSQLSNQTGNMFGLPVVSIDGGRTPTANLSTLGAVTVLSLGPLRQLPR